jgi:hypothetical protein
MISMFEKYVSQEKKLVSKNENENKNKTKTKQKQ